MIRCFLLLVDYGNVVRSVKDSCTAIFLHSPRKQCPNRKLCSLSHKYKSPKVIVGSFCLLFLKVFIELY